ncbi:ABC-type Fe3+-siderophore transport system permease subunit [Sphaerotilus sulfidivorans]|uniref:ABC-type Fe3+-siderophore transport system permease subunit n=1 Tax=Sphaerotilus sulfidivorans TaxID=639200 RepID=A0ABV2IQD4_9BURK
MAAALVLAVLLASRFGAVPVGLDDWLAPPGTETPGAGAHVLWHLRLPRIVFALLVGAGLGLGGALTQALFRNPLADPGLLGVSSGAACAAGASTRCRAASRRGCSWRGSSPSSGMSRPGCCWSTSRWPRSIPACSSS